MLNIKELYDEFNELADDRDMYDEDAERSMPLADYDRYKQLKALDEAIDLLHCWREGKQLIDEDEFADFIKDEMTTIYDLNGSYYIYIDWAKWADNERSDYDEIDFDGSVYLWRA